MEEQKDRKKSEPIIMRNKQKFGQTENQRRDSGRRGRVRRKRGM